MRRPLWLLPTVLLIAWLAVGAGLGPYAGKLGEVQKNDNSSFLPSEAESTTVVKYLSSLSDAVEISAVVVWEAPDDAEDAIAVVNQQIEAFAAIEGVVADRVQGPIPSGDGAAFRAQVPIAFGADSDIADSAVDQLREIIKDAPGGWSAHVTGPAGFSADLGEAFGEIDRLLLFAALGIVLLILLIVYRSPILPFVVLGSSVLALAAASAIVYVLADQGIIDLNGQSQGILFILVIGAATDYALLLVSRYREELAHTSSSFDAMKAAVRGTVEPIIASGTTVILGLLCLLASGLSSLKGLGPVGAIGIACAVVAALTFLPSVLVLIGRASFWPFSPRPTGLGAGRHVDSEGGLWDRMAALVAGRPRRVWATAVVVLTVLAVFVPQFKDDGVPQSEFLLVETDSALGQEAMERHFEAGSSDPVLVLAGAGQATEVVNVAQGIAGVGEVGEPAPVGDKALVSVILSDAADSPAATDTVERLRAQLDDVSSDIAVGGTTAVELDTQNQAADDRNTIIPLILIVTLLVLIVLLRALVVPAILIAVNVLSFGATLGLSALVFNHVFDFPGADPSVTLIGFVFLVALGIDYTIFLMTRVREETIVTDTHRGIVSALRSTGGVITSAGIVLAATFSVLSILPLLFLAQIAFIVAVGVLIDTLIVRTFIVPALAYDIGPNIWWPSSLDREPSGTRGGAVVDNSSRD